jgi:hypothetical protein
VTNNWCWQVIESYDKGYIIEVQVDPGTGVPQTYAWLIKADVNGNRLWTKSILKNSYQAFFSGIENTA